MRQLRAWAITLSFLLGYAGVCTSAQASVAPIFGTDLSPLVDRCAELLLKAELSEEASAELVREQLMRPEVVRQFSQAPGHGVGVIIVNNDGQILLSQRKGSHGEGNWAVPGGKLEEGETVFSTARREVFEETGVEIEDLKFVGVTLDHFPEQNKLFVSFHIVAKIKNGTPRVMEPEKTSTSWTWFKFDQLPRPLFAPMRKLVELGFEPKLF